MSEQIERQLDLPAPAADVWPYILEPALLQEWLADEVTLELHPGGDARFRIGEDERSGWVEEVVAPDASGDARLVFWWQAADEPASRVAVTLTEIENRITRVRIVETRPLEILDVTGIPLPGGQQGSHGPAMVAVCA